MVVMNNTMMSSLMILVLTVAMMKIVAAMLQNNMRVMDKKTEVIKMCSFKGVVWKELVLCMIRRMLQPAVVLRGMILISKRILKIKLFTRFK